VATLPEGRGRGIGSAVTRAALLDARRMEYSIGVLQSSEMGFDVYRRMGFEQFCTVKHYLWGP
jgi:ribosomal protein S18 acetylase RimI-like enzyme